MGVGGTSAKNCQQMHAETKGSVFAVPGLPVPLQAPVRETHQQLFLDEEGIERLAREAAVSFNKLD